MATNIETLIKPNGDQVLPRTRAKAVSMENGTTVEAAINDISDKAVFSPSNAQIGQIIVVSEVDENGKPVSWQATDSVSGKLNRALRLTLTENVAVISVTGLSIKLPITIAFRNTGSNTGTGIALKINGVEKSGFTGGLSSTRTDLPQAMVWLYTANGEMHGYTRMANGGRNDIVWPTAPKIIESIEIDSPYRNDGVTNYFQSGTILDIYEGVFPNVTN